MEEKSKVYNKQNTIKVVAILLMIIDHIGFIVNVSYMRIFAHLGITLFLYSFVSGLKLSKGLNTKKLLILLITAIVSQPFYMYLFSTKGLNIIFLYLLYYVFKYMESENLIINILQAILFCGLVLILKIDYYYFGFTMLYLCDKINNKKLLYIGIVLLNVSFLIFGLFIMHTIIYILQPLSIGIIYLIDSNKLIIYKKINRYVFYLFYPAHITILCLVKVLI